MRTHNDRVNSLIEELVDEIGLPQYIYNRVDFNPEKDSVFYSGPYWDKNEIVAGMKTFLKGKWLVSGENVAKFQWQFSRKFNVKHSHMVNSGSSANLTMITALKKHFGWQDGDEIIVSPVGFPTTISPLVQNNLKPVFIDIEMDTLNFDVLLLEQVITEKTKAIFVSPVLGNPPDMYYIKSLCEDRGILMIGDNCDSLGTKWDGKLLTEYYYAWTTSFYPAHHISTGEGGMVCSNDETLIDTVRSISWWGRDCRCIGSANLLACGTCGNRFDKWLDGYEGIVDHKYLFTNMGYNLKPLDLQGAIGIEQLKKIDEIDTKRRANFTRIKDLIIKYISGANIANKFDEADPSWFGVPIITETPELKEKLQAFFESNRIQTRNYFAGNILLHPGYKHLGNSADYPNANKALSNVFFLGCPPHFGEEVFKYYEEVLKTWKN
jgi:CDP-6-deoxy-D-xylo-4-hexulose-3-dehydrase